MTALHPSVTLTPRGPVHLAGVPHGPDDWGYRWYPAACDAQPSLRERYWFPPTPKNITCPDCLRLIPETVPS